jgi:hypothetical protein
VHALHQLLVVAVAELAGERVIFLQQGLALAHARGDRVEHRHVRIELRLLLDVGDLQALLHDQQAVVQLEGAGNDFQQGGLTGAVAPDQADPLGRFEGEFGVIEQRDVTERELRR